MYSSIHSSKLLASYCKANNFEIVRHHHSGFWDIKLPNKPEDDKEMDIIKTNLKGCGYKHVSDYAEDDGKYVIHIITDTFTEKEEKRKSYVQEVKEPAPQVETVQEEIKTEPSPETTPTPATSNKKNKNTKAKMLSEWCKANDFTLENGNNKAGYRWIIKSRWTTRPMNEPYYGSIKSQLRDIGYCIKEYYPLKEHRFEAHLINVHGASKVETDIRLYATKQSPKTKGVMKEPLENVTTSEIVKIDSAQPVVCVVNNHNEERAAQLKLIKAMLSLYPQTSKLTEVVTEMSKLSPTLHWEVSDIIECENYRGIPLASGFFTIRTNCVRVTVADFIESDVHVRMDEFVDEFVGEVGASCKLVSIGVEMKKYGLTA